MNDKCNPIPFRTSKKGLKAEQKKGTMKSCDKTGYTSKIHCVNLLLGSRSVL